MKQQYNTHNHKTPSLRSALDRSWVKGMTGGFLMLLLTVPIYAQFLKIDIDIPAKTGVSELEAFEPIWPSENSPIERDVEGAFSLTISSSENLHIIATVKHSEYLRNANGQKIQLDASLAYRNDGKNKPSKTIATDVVVFPMSNSGRLIEFMEGSPQTINAYIMVSTTAEMPKNTTTTYTGEVTLTLEYN